MAGVNGMTASGDADPRLNNMIGERADFVSPRLRKLHDRAVTFDEYHYYAQLSRHEEASDSHAATPAEAKKGNFISTIFARAKGKKGTGQTAVDEQTPPHHHDEKATAPTVNTATEDARMNISDDEWINASRALRLASWPAMFYLITTDILGPFGLPFAFATTGWGPGVALYTVFGALAGYSGYLIWHMFLGLDSYQFPVKTYGDLAFRIYGPVARHLINILQSVQLLCNVGVIVIGNGQALSQVAKFKLCYVICCLIFALVGFFLGQIRTLHKFGNIANFAIWLNILVIFMSMGVVAHSLPNYDAAQGGSAGATINPVLVAQLPDGSYPPIKTSAGLPDSSNFSAAVTGLMQAVYSYGGAMLFTEFMSEMRRPRDFIKAMWGAQAFIYAFYMFYGCFLYGYQGQYTVNPSYQGLSPYNWSAACNVISFISALIAAALYGNIGIKVLYNNVLMEFFKFPPLSVKSGKLLWAGIVPIYWSIAFILAASIPNFSGLTGFVAAICILQFTYTFPPFLYLGYIIQRDTLRILGRAPSVNHSTTKQLAELKNFSSPSATSGGSPPLYNDSDDNNEKRIVASNTNSSVTSWHAGSASASDVKAARMKAIKSQWMNVIWLTIYTLGALVTAGIGAWAAIETITAAFARSKLTAFTCLSPLDPAASA